MFSDLSFLNLEINPCDAKPCLNGGTCKASDNGYSCQCPDKFTGDNCETCKYSKKIFPLQNTYNRFLSKVVEQELIAD